MVKPRVLIADDHTLVVEAFETLLAPMCEVIGHVGDGRAMVAAVRKHQPDVVVVDVSMPLLNGLDAARQVRQFNSSTRLVFVTMNEDPDLAAEAFRAGAAGVPAEAVGRLGTARCHPRGDETSPVSDAARQRRRDAGADARTRRRQGASRSDDQAA